MSALTDKQQPGQKLLVLAIVVLVVAIGVMGWAVLKLSSGAMVQQTETGPTRDQLLTAEVKVAIERKLAVPVSMSDMKIEAPTELKGQQMIRFSGTWRPQVDLYVLVPTTEPAVLSPTGLEPEFMAWVKQNPDQVKSFLQMPNPAHGFTTLNVATSTEQAQPVAGTIQMPVTAMGKEQEPEVTFDKPISAAGQPAYKYGPRALAVGSKEHTAISLAKQELQGHVNQGVMMAYQLDLLKKSGAPAKAKLDKVQAEVDKAMADATKAQESAKAAQPEAPLKKTKEELEKEAEKAKQDAEREAEKTRLAKALEERRAAMEKERQAYMAPLLEATKPGKTWVGQWMIERDLGPIGIKFLTQKATGEYTGVLFDPRDPDANKAFTGRIVPDPTRNDGWTLTLTSTPDSGIDVNGPADVMGGKVWLNRAGSSVLYFKLESATTMIGRSGGRAAFKMLLEK